MTPPLERLPPGAVRHTTPAPTRRCSRCSGQVAVGLDGRVLGTSIKEQTGANLENCARQLAAAGCGLGDVFKVDVHLADLAGWEHFNAVDAAMMPEPRPARTAVQAALLPAFVVEIEMWAVKPEDEDADGLGRA